MSFKNCKIKSIGANPADYHNQKEQRGAPSYAVSPSSLKTFIQCPSRWKAGYEPPATEAKDWGSLLDTLLLTPEQFKSRYAVKPKTYKDAKTGEEKPWNGNSNVCKQWLEDHEGLEITTEPEIAEVQKAIGRLNSDETISAFLSESDKQVHVVGEWHGDNGIVVPVQCLIDLVPKLDSQYQKCLGDLKTTRNAAQRPFARWCYTAGYHIQAAFDLALYTAATGEDRTDWVFILSENYAPYEPGRRLLSQDLLQIGTQTYTHALQQYAKCLKTGIWAGYDKEEEFSIIPAESWMEFESLSESLEHEQESQLESINEGEVTP